MENQDKVRLFLDTFQGRAERLGNTLFIDPASGQPYEDQ